MRMEMEGPEPLIVLFGIPLLTTVIVLAAMYIGQKRAEQPPVPITVQPNITVTPRVTAELPPDGIRANITVPPAQIHEVVREVVKLPEVNVINRVDPALPPTVQVNVPEPKPAPSEPRLVLIPAPVPMPAATPVSMAPAPDPPEGKLLPPPKAVAPVTEGR
jgi:hypothetical protein